MASPREISAAASAFANGAVLSFLWGESGRILRVRLSGEDRDSILFAIDEGKLQTFGQPDSAHTKVNVLASIMTILRVLHGAKFHREDLPPAVVEKFRRQLTAPVEKVLRPMVMLSSRAPGEAFDLDYDSDRRETSWRVADPICGMEWLRWQAREPERVAEGFCRWIATKPSQVDIEIRTGEQTIVFSDARAATMHGRTQLELRDGQVRICRTLIDGSGASLPGFIDLGYGLAFLPKKKTFAQVQPAGALSEFSKLGDMRPGDQISHLPADTFFVDFPEAVSGMCELLGKAGAAENPIETGCIGFLDAVTDGQIVHVRLRVKTDAGVFVPAHRALARLFWDLFSHGPFALLVKVFGRRRRLAERLAQTVQIHADDLLEERFLEK